MLNKNTDLALLLLRLWFGLEMAFGHGLGKLQDILAGNLGFADPLGIGMGLSKYLTTFAEFVCALLITIGLKTRLATIPYAFAMLVAAYFHYSKGDGWGDISHPINYMIPAIALYFAGPGRYSLDHQMAQKA